jgi:hypothetical protein
MLALGAGAASAADCDRPCMTRLITTYIDSLVARDASKLPLASATVRYTEDSKDVKLGEGVWKTVTKKGDFRRDYIDLRRQIAAAHFTVHEEGALLEYCLLLRTKDQKITGIETLINRVTPGSRFQPNSLDNRLTGMTDPVPAGKRMERDEMIRIASFYPKGLIIGNWANSGISFAPNAYRIENGTFITGMGCPNGNCQFIGAQNIITHPYLERSVAAVDEEQGIVLLWMNFGFTNSYGERMALVTFEAFKVWGGEIHAIEAFFRTLDQDTKRGWDPEPGDF